MASRQFKERFSTLPELALSLLAYLWVTKNDDDDDLQLQNPNS